MAATRRAPPVQVYQDPMAYEQHALVDSTDAAVYHALGPLSEAARNQQMRFEPEYHYPSIGSPVKHPDHSTSPSPNTLHVSQFGAVNIPPPQAYAAYTQSPTKRIPSFYNAPNLPSNIAMTPSVPSNYNFVSPVIDQENVYGMPFQHSKQDFPGPDMYGHKGPLKRTLLEAAPLAPVADARSNMKKHKKVGSLPLKPVMTPLPSSQPQSEGPIEIPSPRSLPKLEADDGSKPTYKYAQLIGMAILRAPGHRLTLASIYKWISDNFSFYQASDSGWQNSIRHNLSLNKAFIKQERPKDDPGKGNYWAIKPGCEGQFLKGQPKRMADANLYLGSLVEPVRPSTAPSMTAPDFPPPLAPAKIDSSRFPDDTEISSDATIPASDPAIHDGIDRGENGEDHTDIRSSPPPADIRSSPPPGPEEPCGTPPPVPLFPGYTHSGGHKRKFSRVNQPVGDSGYYSSIESSVTRNRGNLMTSEADVAHPSKRRGRAEEEIARIRSSSYDSPSKNAPTLHPPTITSTIPSSSPFRPFNAYNVPLTPPVVFKKPAKPILSISPSTNLRNHRDHVKRLLASPDKGLGHFTSSPLRLELFTPLKDVVSVLDDEEHEYNGFGTGSPVARGLSDKRGPKRPRLERAATTTSVLADITGSSLTLSEIPPSPYRLVKKDWHDHAGLGSPSRFWPSPIKKTLPKQQAPTSAPLSMPAVSLAGAPSSAIPTLQLQTDDDFLFGIEIPSDSSEAGFDVMQDFAKIGAPATTTTIINTPSLLASAGSTPTFVPTAQGWPSGSPSKPLVAAKKALDGRPQLGRSNSSRF